MTAACLQSSLTAVRPWDNRSGVWWRREKRKKKKKNRSPLRFVYLRCIPTVVQAAERETGRKEDGEEREREEGGTAALKK